MIKKVLLYNLNPSVKYFLYIFQRCYLSKSIKMEVYLNIIWMLIYMILVLFLYLFIILYI